MKRVTERHLSNVVGRVGKKSLTSCASVRMFSFSSSSSLSSYLLFQLDDEDMVLVLARWKVGWSGSEKVDNERINKRKDEW